ncbi:MAG TPA: Holliday junction branch migration protein RuvA [Rhodocyclaceae bacterium]|nr:Holliday junction branch migration protein RuvA [Zoogloeaceae bacterium]HRD35007.1 Holliday junction branch migration protein RuvA [Rhodocyclaceae bacterium]
MIGRITGTLLEKNPPQIVVDVHGLGYELDVPMSTFYNLPATGEKLSLFTHFAVREDGHFLYGFATAAERSAFRQLLKVSGIGARTALSVLSGLSVTDLQQAIALQESARLIRIPGIGKKTAERLLLELRDRLGQALPGASSSLAGQDALASTAPDSRSDIMNALLALGYNDREALAAMKAVPEDSGVSDGIRLALKQLAKV